MTAGTRRKPREERTLRLPRIQKRGQHADEAITDLSRQPAGDKFGGDHEVPQPSYTPNPPAPTGPMPVLPEDPLDPSVPVPPSLPPFIGDSIPQGAPEPAPAPDPGPGPGVLPVLYDRAGWALLLTDKRRRSGEWDDPAAIAERGFGENAAETATALRHSRQAIMAAAWRVCDAAGRPDLAGELLCRVAAMNEQAREDTSRRDWHEEYRAFVASQRNHIKSLRGAA
jgi:hypothetical protein